MIGRRSNDGSPQVAPSTSDRRQSNDLSVALSRKDRPLVNDGDLLVAPITNDRQRCNAPSVSSIAKDRGHSRGHSNDGNPLVARITSKNRRQSEDPSDASSLRDRHPRKASSVAPDNRDRRDSNDRSITSRKRDRHTCNDQSVAKKVQRKDEEVTILLPNQAKGTSIKSNARSVEPHTKDCRGSNTPGAASRETNRRVIRQVPD
jgi:hypothetical protein